MITCLVCKESKSEGYFVDVKYGGLAICSDCKNTPEAKRLREESEKRMEATWNRQEEYEEKKREAKKHQIYDGQYDWM